MQYQPNLMLYITASRSTRVGRSNERHCLHQDIALFQTILHFDETKMEVVSLFIRLALYDEIR